VFSGRLQVVEHSVSEIRQGFNREYIVESNLRSLEKIDGELMMLFSLLNKKMEVLVRKAVKPIPPISGWKAGEVKTIKASLSVPADRAREVFSLEIGFYDPSRRQRLTYRPEYLIYKRIASS
jgi:hypothetical protein